jgi:hypothetical protein
MPTPFQEYARKTLRGLREVKDITFSGETQATVLIDYSGIQLPWVLGRLDQIASMWKAYYPDAGMTVTSQNDNYIGRFPLDTVEAVLGSGVVATTYD